MKTLIATGNARLDGALFGSLDGCMPCSVKSSDQLIDICLKQKPMLVIISNKLPINEENATWGDILPYLKQKLPESRFIFIDNTLRKDNLDDKYLVQTLIAYGVYDIYTHKKIILKKILKLVHSPNDRYTNDKWLKEKQEKRILKYTVIGQAMPLLSNNSGKITIKRELIGGLLIIVGISLTFSSLKPILEMKQNNNETQAIWEETKLTEDETKKSEGMLTLPKDNELIGMIKITPNSKAIGIRYNVTKENLDYGAGLDKNSSLITKGSGNSVLYAHREEFFWGLKDIKEGDVITIELPDGILEYEVYTTFITTPEDKSFYEISNDAEITLVTCHPFIYMGPTPERFIVKAKLIN